MNKKTVIIFFIFLSNNVLAEQGNRNVPVTKATSDINESKNSIFPIVKYLCKDKILDRKEVSAKFHEECEKTIINISPGIKVEMINNINRKEIGKYIFHEVSLIHDFLAFIDIFYFEQKGAQVTNLLVSKEVFKIANAKPLFSPDHKNFLINGEFDPFYDKADSFSTKLFKIDGHKIINELEIRYSEGGGSCIEAKKCAIISYVDEGVFEFFKWEGNNKLISSRCKISDDETVPLITNKCHDVWIEKVKDEWQVSWERQMGKNK